MGGKMKFITNGFPLEILELADRLEIEHPEAAEIAHALRDIVFDYNNTILTQRTESSP
jgi:hypothetical protein